MTKHHSGTTVARGSLNRGTHVRPSPTHGGSGSPKGVVHAPRPQVYVVHGRTDLRQGVLKGKRK